MAQDELKTAPATVGVEEKAAIQVTSTSARLVNLFGYGRWTDEPTGVPSLDDVMKLSTALLALDVISQDIGKVTLRLRRRVLDGSEIVMPKEHRVAAMLADVPNEEHTWQEFVEMLLLHLVAVQNGFVGKVRSRSNHIEQLIPFMPGRIRVLVDAEAGLKFFYVDAVTPFEKMMLRHFDGNRVLLADEVIHFRGRPMDGLFGYSNMEAGSSVFALAKAVQDFQTRLYRHDAMLRGVFQMGDGQSLSEGAFKRLKDDLRDLYTKMRQEGRPLVLEEGIEFKPISMQADQAETAKAKNAGVEDIARVFRIPPHKLMHIVNVKYENMETLERSYVQDTLVPWAGRVEKRLAVDLLTPEERAIYFFEFDREEMSLQDQKVQAEVAQIYGSMGALMIDEMRRKRGLNPLPNGAGRVRLIPANMMAVDENNEIVITPPAQSQQTEETEQDDVSADEET